MSALLLEALFRCYLDHINKVQKVQKEKCLVIPIGAQERVKDMVAGTIVYPKKPPSPPPSLLRLSKLMH